MTRCGKFDISTFDDPNLGIFDCITDFATKIITIIGEQIKPKISSDEIIKSSTKNGERIKSNVTTGE